MHLHQVWKGAAFGQNVVVELQAVPKELSHEQGDLRILTRQPRFVSRSLYNVKNAYCDLSIDSYTGLDSIQNDIVTTKEQLRAAIRNRQTPIVVRGKLAKSLKVLAILFSGFGQRIKEHSCNEVIPGLRQRKPPDSVELPQQHESGGHTTT